MFQPQFPNENPNNGQWGNAGGGGGDGGGNRYQQPHQQQQQPQFGQPQQQQGQQSAPGFGGGGLDFYDDFDGGGMGAGGSIGGGGGASGSMGMGPIGGGGSSKIGGGGGASGIGGGFDDDEDRPLLEELGIDFSDIFRRARIISNPFHRYSSSDLQVAADSDLAGPLFFALFLGFCLLLTGKVHFGYIYGFGLVGCLLTYLVLNLMSDDGISIDRTSSILGYSLLPVLILAFVNVVINLQGTLGFILSVLAVAGCTINATRFIEKALGMRTQRYLIAYPIGLLYTCFVMLTVF